MTDRETIALIDRMIEDESNAIYTSSQQMYALRLSRWAMDAKVALEFIEKYQRPLIVSVRALLDFPKMEGEE